LKVQFRNSARIGETITKKLWVKELKTSSIICEFLFENEFEKTVLEGEVTLVNVKIQEDRQSIKAEAFNKEIKARIRNYEL
jgi:4-hydroxybenzoyl-CoA thioesterase